MSSAARLANASDSKSTFVLRGTRRVYERPRPFTIEHIALDLRIDEAAGAVAGSAAVTIARVNTEASELSLDAVGFDLHQVTLLSGKGSRKQRHKAHYSYDGNTIVITIPSAVTRAIVEVHYDAKPRRGMYFLHPDEEVPQRPRQVWTQCQDEDARHIFPCHDKPHARQTLDVTLQVPPGWFALCNGDLVNPQREQKKGLFRYRMKQPLPSYLVTMVAGEFATMQDKLGDLPIRYYVPKGREEDGKRTFLHTPVMIKLFAHLTGVPFPWSKYAQIVVSDFIFGGMENTGATTMYEHILLDAQAAIDVSSDDLIAHELAHQWFGDLVTCRDWSHAWLNEGFATFMEHVWRQHHLGQDDYDHHLQVDLNAYLNEARNRYKRPVVCQDYQAPIDVFDRHLYEKGGLFLHALRCQLGNDTFWRGVNHYLTQHAHSEVETRDLLRAMEHVSGDSLEELFDHTLLRAEYPRLNVRISYDKGQLIIVVKQTLADKSRPFALPLEVDIADKPRAKPRRLVRRIDEAEHTFVLPYNKRPHYVVVDPRLRIIGAVVLRCPADMLRHQLADAPSGRGRSLAARALGKRDDPPSTKALASALGKGRLFWGTRAAAARALGNIRSEDAFAALRDSTRVRHPKVRRAVMLALGNFRHARAATILERSAHHDKSLLVMASACRALGSTKQDSALPVLSKLVDRTSWADCLRAGAIDGLARLKDERALELLYQHTRYGYPNRGRRTAINALSKFAQSRRTREHLEELLDDRDPYLRVSVVEAFRELGDVEARPALRRQLERELDGRVRRRIR